MLFIPLITYLQIQMLITKFKTFSPQCSDAIDEAIGCSPRQRFQLELEFVQSLASPHYLNFLAQSLYLDDPAFIAFLEYLKYWKQPEYARFVV